MTIKRKYLKHGDIVEIHLPLTNSFAYGKLVDPRKIRDPFEYPFFIRIYNFTCTEHIVDVSKINRQLLLAPFWLQGQSVAVTKANWKILANEPVDLHEEFIPDTKREFPIGSANPEKWTYVKRFNTIPISTEYAQIKHLDYSSGKNIEIVPFLVQLEILKQKGKDIKKEYGLKDWLEELYYKNFINMPVYVDLPEKLKEKLAC
ncbi:MAG: Imm26 family immunity protein [Candidatus Kapaibacterium sp.]|nr:hypothetical protein [Bacteroidota bacterium]